MLYSTELSFEERLLLTSVLFAEDAGNSHRRKLERGQDWQAFLSFTSKRPSINELSKVQHERMPNTDLKYPTKIVSKHCQLDRIKVD